MFGWGSKSRMSGQSLRGYAEWVTRHPYAVMVMTLLVSAFLAYQMVFLRIGYEADSVLPKDHPLVISVDRINEIGGGKYMTLLAVSVKDGDVFQPEVLACVKRITDAIADFPGVMPDNVWSLTSPKVSDMKGTADGVEITPLMEKLPVTPEEMAAFKAKVLRNELIEGLLISKDRKVALILSEYENMEAIDGAAQLYKRLETLTRKEASPRLQFHLAGQPVLLRWMDVYSGRVALLLPLAILVIGALHFHAFRTWQGLFIPLLTAFLSIVWTMGLLGLLRIKLDPYNMSTPILVLGVAAGHSVQILKRYYEEFHILKDNRAAVVAAIIKIGPAMLTAGLVAAAGLASLMTFKAPVVRNFGLLSAFGIMAALLLEMTLIPAMRTLLPAPTVQDEGKEQTRSVFDSLVDHCYTWSIRCFGRIVFIAVVLLAVAMIGISRLEINNSFPAYFPASSKPMQDLNFINERIAGTFNLQIMLEGPAPDSLKDPEVIAQIHGLQRLLEKRTDVGKTISMVDFLTRMNKVMHNDDPAYFKPPDTRALAAQYFLLLSGNATDMDRLMDSQYQKAIVTVYTKLDDDTFTRNLMGDVTRYVDQHLASRGFKVSFGGSLAGQTAIVEVITNGKIVNMLQVSGIIFLASSLVFGSFLAGLLILMPLVLTVLLNLGIMGYANIWMNIATASISAMALGMGADYGIYFLFRTREALGKGLDWEAAIAQAETTSGKAILYVATAITLGYSCTMLSGFSIHIYMGFMTSLTMALSSLSSLTLLPTLLNRFRPSFLLPKKKGE